MKNTIIFKTSLGSVEISEENGFISELFFLNGESNSTVVQETPLLKEAQNQLFQYLSGNRKEFDLPLSAEGTTFQKAVWKALQQIPYGETRSYKQVAELIGRPDASRAVGMANNKNPILIFIPCHRVVGSNGKLVGYVAGLETKEKLLEIEKSHLNY